MLATDGEYLQLPLTLSGTTGDQNVVQTSAFWKDTGQTQRLVARVQVEQQVDVTLYLETCATRDSTEEGSPWTVVQSWAAGGGPYDDVLYLYSSADVTNDKSFQRFLRWRAKSATTPSGTWEVTFSIAVVAK